MIKILLISMVRNEGKIIRRCLESALPIIDAVFVLDTGSTDNTTEEIEKFLSEHNLPGKIEKEKFVDFGSSRSKSFFLARKYMQDELQWDKDTSYGLLLDADHVLIVRPVFNKQIMLGQFDHYKIRQKDTSSYYNIRLIKMNQEWECIGKTHEVWTVRDKKNVIWIDDKSDGGCKSDKYERDLRLLLAGLEENDIDYDLKSRYYFYLGQTYNALKQYKKSNESYFQRIEMDGWDEEKWFAMIIVIKNFIELNKLNDGDYQPEIESWAQRAFNFRPIRCESLYLAGDEFIRTKKYDIAEKFISLGKSVCTPPENELLFVDDEMYQYGFDLLDLKLKEARGDSGKDALKICLQIMNKIDKKKVDFCVSHMIPHIPLIPIRFMQGFCLTDMPNNLSINCRHGRYELLIHDNLITLNSKFLQIGNAVKITEFNNKTGVLLANNLFTTKEGDLGIFRDGKVEIGITKTNGKVLINENVMLDSIKPWKINNKILIEDTPAIFDYLKPCLPALKYNEKEYILFVTGNIQTDNSRVTICLLIYTDKDGNYIKHGTPFFLDNENGIGVCSFTINTTDKIAVVIYFAFENNSLNPRFAQFDLENIL
jgi:glycosyltransferase involved in cell wall biosynthesis